MADSPTPDTPAPDAPADSTDRTSFMPGVLIAVRAVADLDEGLLVGLEHLLDR